MLSSETKDEIFDLIGQTVTPRLSDQLRFVLEIDKLKTIIRQTPLLDISRRENDAEHSWHLAMMAMMLAEYAAPDVRLERVLRMVLIHDIVEIDAGDTFLYDATAEAGQEEREQKAADRLFGLLPKEQAVEFRSLWDEFEAHQSPDARFARTMDRMQPFLHNVFTGGHSWKHHGVTADQVQKRMAVIADGSTLLHGLVTRLIEESVARGFLLPSSSD
ncbi:HD domain-containing protein [Cohaesibacter celericrescens]|uniref:Phosphohydrolase n=1 Tax=Cohaesibacter celericrescens TaxID=2067669 RepID=A0A2N5XS87_9HYPH|nr:HD domain-containing protein [Cohaesibacter celericrescens]PLW77354.1 phosphohydrolase [Cohaesibacter celericrescens]